MQPACPVSPAAATIHRWLATVLLAGSAVTCLSTAAQERGRTPTAPAERSPLQWIEAIQRAAVRVNYSGTIVYQAGGEMRTSRITHMFDGARSHERVQTLDGKPREYIRLRTESNDEVRCLIPESRRVIVEHRAIEDPFPGLIGAPAEAVLERYDLKTGEIERVAGVKCQVLTLAPRDALRYGYRLCVDRSTGLLLRAQTVGEQREVLEQVAFTDIRIGEKIDRIASETGMADRRLDRRAQRVHPRGCRSRRLGYPDARGVPAHQGSIAPYGHGGCDAGCVQRRPDDDFGVHRTVGGGSNEDRR